MLGVGYGCEFGVFRVVSWSSLVGSVITRFVVFGWLMWGGLRSVR